MFQSPYLQVLLESDGQDLSHDDGGSSSLSSLIPAIISAQSKLLQSREWMEVVLCFLGGQMNRECVRFL